MGEGAVTYPTGTSHLEQWPRLINAIESSVWPHERILDVGAGHGKAGVLLREYLNVKPLLIEALDADPHAFCHLLTGEGDGAYQDSWLDDIREFPDHRLARFDTVLMADVIEHIPKADGMALLNRIPGQVIVSTPVDAEVAAHTAAGEATPALERHVSQWSQTDFVNTYRLDQWWVEVGQLIVRLRPRDRQPGWDSSFADGDDPEGG